MSRKIYHGHPPPSYRKALRNLFSISLNPPDKISIDMDVKLNAAIQAMHNPNTNDGLAAIDSLRDFVNSTIEQNGEQITQTDAKPDSADRKAAE